MTDNDQPLIENDFFTSWDHVFNRFEYEQNEFGSSDPLRDLMKSLRQRGYDRKLRAGKQIGYVVLSRSRHHGLHRGQAVLRMYMNFNNKLAIHYSEPPDTVIELQLEQVTLMPELEALLNRLGQQPID